jgi:hypothetical protein
MEIERIEPRWHGKRKKGSKDDCPVYTASRKGAPLGMVASDF